MECESLNVCHLRHHLKLPHANALMHAHMHEHVRAHTHACTYAHTTHTHTRLLTHTNTQHTHTAPHSEDTAVTGGGRAGCPRVPCMAAGRKPHRAVGPHHLQNGGVHVHRCCGQEPFPQRGHSLHHHPARICWGQYSLVTCFGGHHLFWKCTETEHSMCLVFFEGVLWQNQVCLVFLKVYCGRTRYVTHLFWKYCDRTRYVSRLFWKCTVTEPVCVSSFFDGLLWQNQRYFVWWLGWFPLQTF